MHRLTSVPEDPVPSAGRRLIAGLAERSRRPRAYCLVMRQNDKVINHVFMSNFPAHPILPHSWHLTISWENDKSARKR